MLKERWFITSTKIFCSEKEECFDVGAVVFNMSLSTHLQEGEARGPLAPNLDPFRGSSVRRSGERRPFGMRRIRFWMKNCRLDQFFDEKACFLWNLYLKKLIHYGNLASWIRSAEA